MSGTEYLAPTNFADAIGALRAASGAARVLAGGTDFLAQARNTRTWPNLIVDLKQIPGMLDIRPDGGGFLIGAATAGATIGESAALARSWPGLVEAATLIGSKQVQGRASLGGNLCNASPAADGVPALIAAGAICVIEGPRGRRELPVEHMQVSPGKNALAPDEILVALRLPPRLARSSDAYLRFIPRTEMDIAVAGAGASLSLDGAGVCQAARISIGAVAPRALLVEDAGAALVGSKLEEAALARMDGAVAAACKPINDKRGTAEFRTKVVCVLARRAAKIAYERAGA